MSLTKSQGIVLKEKIAFGQNNVAKCDKYFLMVSMNIRKRVNFIRLFCIDMNRNLKLELVR